MKPEYPLHIKANDEPEETVRSEEELVTTLEWFDSATGDASVRVTDAQGRPVRLRIEAMVVKVLEVGNS